MKKAGLTYPFQISLLYIKSVKRLYRDYVKILPALSQAHELFKLDEPFNFPVSQLHSTALPKFPASVLFSRNQIGFFYSPRYWYLHNDFSRIPDKNELS